MDKNGTYKETHHVAAKITKARITASATVFDPPPTVYVILEGETEEQRLFSYYPDEISFTEAEFIGHEDPDAVEVVVKDGRVVATIVDGEA
jgi:hypothetical protein